MRFLFDFFPIVVFFVAYYLPDDRDQAMFIATAAIMVACLVQVLAHRMFYGRFEKMHLVMLVIVFLMGGATLLLQDRELFKWKPTVASWLSALIFLGSQYIGKRNCVQYMLEHAMQLPDLIWARLNLNFVIFFVILGALNVYVFRNFSEPVWVNFKLFGVLGLTLVFMVAQTVYLTRASVKYPNVLKGSDDRSAR